MKKRKNEIVGNIFHWFLTVLITSFFPYILVIVIDSYVGYGIRINKHIPDYILVVFTICINTIILSVENREKSKNNYHLNLWIILLLLTISTIVMYCGLFNEYISSIIFEKINENIKFVIMFWVIGAICLIVEYIVSYLTENLKKEKIEDNKARIENIKEVIGEKRRLNAKDIDIIKENLNGIEF